MHTGVLTAICCLAAAFVLHVPLFAAQQRSDLASIPTDTPPDVRQDIELLQSIDPVSRASAAGRLGRMGGRAKAASPFLIDLLADTVQLEYRFGPPSGFVNPPPGLGAGSVGRFAAVALGDIKDIAAVDPLIVLLSSASAQVRELSALALSRIGDRRAVEPLGRVVLADPERRVRLRAAEGLRSLGGPAAIESLRAAVSDGDGLVREEAAKALIENNDEPTRLLLLSRLAAQSTSERVETISMLTGVKDPWVVDLFLKGLSDESAKVRYQAVVASGRRTDERLTRPLIALLADEDSLVRSSAATALGQRRDLEAFDALCRVLNDGASFVRSAAVAALQALGDARAVAPLVAVASDTDPLVRGAAVTALGVLKDIRSLELLARILNHDSDQFVRAMAATSLGQLGDARAVDALTAALADDSNLVRDNARQALAAIRRR